MATYYINTTGAGRGWSPSQTGSIGNPFMGSAGFQTAISLCIPGDTVLVQGNTFALAPIAYSCELMVTATVSTDKTATWIPGDLLQNTIGTGNHWTGTLFSITATTMVIELLTGVYGAYPSHVFFSR